MKIVIALLIFGLIVLAHEFGHFLLAKKSGIDVLEFSIGFGPRLISFTRGGTRYSLKLLPLGGSCAMLGEDENSTEPNAFNNKSVWARIAVVAAGPVFNFIFAFLLLLIVIGAIGYDKPVLYSVTADSPAETAGLKEGDVITRFNGHTIHFAREISTALTFDPLDGSPISVTWLRDGQKTTAEITPVLSDSGSYLIGIGYNPGYREKTGVLNTVKYAFYEVGYWIETTVKSLGMMIRGKVKTKDISGPVGIINTIGNTYEQSRQDGVGYVLLNLMNISILLSANLGVMNLLPLPALDGGRLMFLVIEAIRRKPVNPEKEGMVHLIGFILLLILMGFVMYNDIVKLITGVS